MARGAWATWQAIAATTRTEWPFVALGLLSLAAPVAVLDQGGDWRTALLSCPALLAAPGAAIEAMLGLARATLWLEGGVR